VPLELVIVPGALLAHCLNTLKGAFDMKKLCPACLNIFHSEIAVEYCPMVECAGDDLVEIDDQIVDVIRGLWDRGICTKSCCSGHVYECLTGAYIVFNGFYNEWFDMDLVGFRGLLIAVNGDDSRVVIEEFDSRDGEQTFTVRSVRVADEMNPKQKLKSQFDFVDFFYDVFARIDDFLEEIEIAR
jgi:hypothetical protein